MNKIKIAQELLIIAKSLSAASEIELDELPDNRKALLKKLHIKPTQIFDGINGYIVMGKVSRMDKQYLKKLTSDSNFRWLEAMSDNEVAIGF